MTVTAVDEAQIKKLLGGIDIPSCPAVLSELMAEARKDDANVAHMGVLVAKDVALAAGVMKIANSPLFGMRGRLGNVAQAINFLGMRNVLNLVTGELLRNALGKGNASLNRFWDGSLLTAQVCQRLAKRIRGVDPQSAYLFGLFHDCAMPMLMRRFPDYTATLRAANAETERSFTDIEDVAHGTNHASVGFLLAKSWGLPAEMAQAIGCHHDYAIFAPDSGVDDVVCLYVALGVLAERAINMQRRLMEDGEWVKASALIAGYLGFSETELIDLFEDLSGFVSELYEIA